jgi:O-antigen/teichoic acid export membrane protein
MLRGPASRHQFIEVFNYGKDRFLATFGDRMLRVAPGFVVARYLGLEATAMWGVGQKIIQIAEQMLSKPLDMSYPYIAEMYVKRQWGELDRRYGQICHGLSLLVGAVTCGAIIGLGGFVDLWTGGEIAMPGAVAAGFGLLLCAQMLKRSLWMTVTIPKNMGWTRVTNFADLGMFCLLALVTLAFGAGFGILVMAVAAATIGTSVPYMLGRARGFPFEQGLARVLSRYRLLIIGIASGLLGWSVSRLLVTGGAVVELILAVGFAAATFSVGALLTPDARVWLANVGKRFAPRTGR